jgi:selenoprotein W-related protein
LKSALGAESELVASGGGVFEITVDGKTVFSKRSLGRFPNDGEVLDLIRAG